MLNLYPVLKYVLVVTVSHFVTLLYTVTQHTHYHTVCAAGRSRTFYTGSMVCVFNILIVEPFTKYENIQPRINFKLSRWVSLRQK